MFGPFTTHHSQLRDIVNITKINRAGTEYRLVELRARVRRTKNPDVYMVKLVLAGLAEPAAFFTSPSEVVANASNGSEVDGKVRAILLEELADGNLVVLMPGDPVTYGPRLIVPKSLAS
jgi:hypothetical protein